MPLYLLGPERRVGAGIHQLGGDAQRVAGPPNGAGQQVLHAQLTPDLPCRLRGALHLHRRVARDEAQGLDAGQVRDELVGQPVTEELVVCGAHVRERQDGHRPGFRFGGRRRSCRSRAGRRRRLTDCRHDIGAGRVPVLRSLREQPVHDRSHPGRHVRARGGHRRRRPGEPFGNRGRRGRRRERDLAGQHLVEHASEGEEVASAIDDVTRGLFRAHVRRRADRDADLGEGRRRLRGGSQSFADAEVGHDGVPFVQQDVLRLDVAMHDVVPVRVGEGVCHLGGDANRVIDRQRAVVQQPITKRPALHDRHHEVQESVGFARVMEGQNVRVVQPGGKTDLPNEALAPERLRHTGLQHLERHVAVMPQVARQIHRGHAAGAELAIHAIAPTERRRQMDDLGAHRSVSRDTDVRNPADRASRRGFIRNERIPRLMQGARHPSRLRSPESPHAQPATHRLDPLGVRPVERAVSLPHPDLELRARSRVAGLAEESAA